MTKVRNPSYLCAQCCLSSFLKDNGVHKSPIDINNEFPDVSCPNSDELMRICPQLGISIEKLPMNYTIQDNDQDGSILIGLHSTDWKINHIVRLFKKIGDDFVVMEPDDPVNDLTWLPKWQCDQFIVEYYRIGYFGKSET